MAEIREPECFQTPVEPPPSPPPRKHFSQLLSPADLTRYIAAVYKTITTSQRGVIIHHSFTNHAVTYAPTLTTTRDNFRHTQQLLTRNLCQVRIASVGQPTPVQPPPYTVRDFLRDLLDNPSNIPTDLDTYHLSQLNTAYRGIFGRVGGISPFDHVISAVNAYSGSRYSRQIIPPAWLLTSSRHTLAAYQQGIRNLMRNLDAWLTPDGVIRFRTPPLPLTGVWNYPGNRTVTASVTIDPMIISFRPPYNLAGVKVQFTKMRTIYRDASHYNFNEMPLQPSCSYKKYPHPHVYHHEPCLGEAAPIVNTALDNLDFLSAADAINSMLAYYNDASPYVDLRAYIKADDLGIIPGTNRLRPRTRTDPDTGEPVVEHVCTRCQCSTTQPLTSVGDDDAQYCEECCDTNTYVCPGCENRYNTADGYRFRITEDGERSELHCDDCRADLSTTCVACGTRYLDELMQGEHSNLCPNCYNPDSSDDEEPDDEDDDDFSYTYPRGIVLVAPTPSNPIDDAIRARHLPGVREYHAICALCIHESDLLNADLSLPGDFTRLEPVRPSVDDPELPADAMNRHFTFLPEDPANPDSLKVVVGTYEGLHDYLNTCANSDSWRERPEEIFYFCDVDAFSLSADGEPIFTAPTTTTTISAAPEPIYCMGNGNGHEIFTFNPESSVPLHGCRLIPCDLEFRGPGLVALVGTRSQIETHYRERYGVAPHYPLYWIATSPDNIPDRIREADLANIIPIRP